MENQLPTTAPAANDQQVIITLLKEQNQTLHQILSFHQRHDQIAFRNAIIGFCFHAIPYIALVIVGYFVYMSLLHYMQAVNTDIKSIHDNLNGITSSMKNMAETVSNAPAAISDSIKNLLHF